VTLETTIVERLNDLISEGQGLRLGSEHGQVLNQQHMQDCRGWLAAMENIVQMIIPDPNSAYRRNSEIIASTERGLMTHTAVGDACAVLENLIKDAQSGLISSVVDHARAEVFDDFLDHAKEYVKRNHKNEAGVIAGVVFEDSLRRVCRNKNITERDQNLDMLISALTKSGVLSDTKAKRARVCAHVRTKATHAQWDEFDTDDVQTTIQFSEEFISSFLEK